MGTDTSDWPGVQQFLKLERETTVKGETRRTVSYAVTSHSPSTASADRLLRLWRDRWAIENRAFWVKDVTFREDHCRARTGNGAYCLSVLRNATMNYIRASGNSSIVSTLRTNALKLKHTLAKLGILI